MITHSADVWVGPIHAATLESHPDGTTVFRYTEQTVRAGAPQVATTLPVTKEPITCRDGALPAFFSNLLPEGRRLSSLKRRAKASLDDELTLLLLVGGSTIGDVSIVPPGTAPHDSVASIDLGNELDFSQVLSSAGIVDPAALPGVQDKASARTIATPVAGDYILKISPPEYPALVENEAACFDIARDLRRQLPAAHHQVIHDVNGRSGLLVTRFDRSGTTRWHVEDAAQLLNIPPGMKYAPSMEEVAGAVASACTSKNLALLKISYMVALAWLTGNGDFHAKNISVINRGKGTEIAPLYDIPSTAAYGDHTLALSVAGATDNLSLKRFWEFTSSLGLTERAAQAVATRTLDATRDAADRIIAAAQFDPRRARDLRRVLAYRRKLWNPTS